MSGRPPTQGSERARPHLAEFASLLGTVRQQSGLTVRQLAARIRYSHPHVARAATGRRLPGWELTEAYLRACGLGGEDLQAWRRLWVATKAKERAFRKVGAGSGSGMPAVSAEVPADDEWDTAVAAVRRVVPLLTLIQRVATLDDLRAALIRLGERRRCDTLRKVEAVTGIPRATLHGWYTGKRKPNATRLDQLVVGLGATRAEQHEFAQCLERIADRIAEGSGCDDAHPTTGQPCILSTVHKGHHRTADGTAWLDGDGQADTSRPVTLPADYREPTRDEFLNRLDRHGATQPGDNVASALRLLNEQLDMRLRTLGANHPDTLATRSSLASWTGQSGDTVGAVVLFAELLADRLRVYGPNHPKTLTTRSNLASWTGKSGDTVGAVALFEQLLADRLRVYGPDHPKTLTTRSKLAFWIGQSGDVDGAVRLLKELLEAQQRVRGRKHPATRATRNHLTFWTDIGRQS